MELLYNKIKQDIINQALKPGERLPERELAEKFNVSRTPIRQVLQKLASEGLVEYVPYRGAFIKDLTIEEFKEITELRMLLEKYAVETCCSFIEEGVLNQIDAIIIKQHEAINLKDVKEYSLLDQEFHYLLVKATNNKELQYHFQILNQKSYLSRVRTLALPGQMERSIAEHKEIVKWIKEKDKDKAGSKASAHVEDALETYINVHNIMMQLK